MENTTLYQQLADDLSSAINRGTLPPGSRLPSVRKTAHSRQLSLNTVVAAYRVLEDRGLVEARPQSGYYVKARLASPARGALREAGPAQGTDGAVLDLIGAALQAQQTPGYIDMALAGQQLRAAAGFGTAAYPDCPPWPGAGHGAAGR